MICKVGDVKEGIYCVKTEREIERLKTQDVNKKKIQREVTKDHCPQMFYTDANCLSLLGEGDEVL